MQLRNARYLSRDLLAGFVRPGDAVVDATAGNGHDTLALCQTVGPAGAVYAFDVQEAALASTRALLEQNGVLDGRVHLILDSHANMERHVPGPVRCVLFNLGWLPTGDHGITTRVPSTLAAVDAALRLLAPGGAASICCYPGHEEGARELAALRTSLEGLDIRRYNVLEARFANQRADAPHLFLVQRAMDEPPEKKC